MRWLIVSLLVVIHLALVVAGEAVPAALAPVIAGSLYLPLGPLAEMGLPVFSPAEAGGWSRPNGLGWLMFVAVWSFLWTAVVAGLARIRR